MIAFGARRRTTVRDEAAHADWLGPVLTAFAFVAIFAAFAWQLAVYWKDVRTTFERDLQSRADLAAIVLAEPLRTLDFKAIRAFAAKCAADGLRLRICDGSAFFVSDEGNRGGFYDTADGVGVVHLFKTARSGNYTIGVGRPVGQMMTPFLKSFVLILLAGLLGVAGVFFFFLTTWRQRIRIRALARTEKFRREFIADISHEIKTPLTGILGAAEMMEAEMGGKGRTGAGGGMGILVGMVRKEGARLNTLVQQVLDLSRLEREGEILKIEEVDLAEIMRETVARFRPRADAAGVKLSITEDSAKALVAHCDATLVSQTLANLVENALRHSGSPAVRMSCTRSGKTARLVVEDEGRGVPAGEEERIFERFHRVDPARAAETGGAGLGLAIARRIMRLHGGDVVCERVKPHGARFSATLPL